MSHLIQQSLFVFRFRYFKRIHSCIRKKFFQMQGMKVGSGVSIPKLYTTWPHQVSLGKNCILEHSIYFKYDGIWTQGPSIIIGDDVFIGSGCEFNIKESIVIGDNCLIASGVRFVDHDHGLSLEFLMNTQSCPSASIVVENNVWIGANVCVLKGVEIQSGAVVAAGAVVTKSISKNEIWGGVPAKKIGERK